MSDFSNTIPLKQLIMAIMIEKCHKSGLKQFLRHYDVCLCSTYSCYLHVRIKKPSLLFQKIIFRA